MISDIRVWGCLLLWLHCSCAQTKPLPSRPTASQSVNPSAPASPLLEKARNGDAIAQFRLGATYLLGTGGQQSRLDEAEKWIRKAAEQGLVQAQETLGSMYATGTVVEKDYAVATDWYKKAAEQEWAQAQRKLVDTHNSRSELTEDYHAIIQWYHKAAEQGRANAELLVGILNLLGRGVEKNLPEGEKWLRKAAGHNQSDAQNVLGEMYEHGIGVERNYVLSIEWYRKAANNKQVYGENSLGLMYANGKGVERDYLEAVRWFHLAAERQLAPAQYNLGYLYANGLGVEKNSAEATKWFNRAALKGFKGYNTATRSAIHLPNENLPSNPEANIPVPAGATGQGENKEQMEIVAQYRSAAEQGETHGQNNFGVMNENGIGYPKNLIEAYAWYNVAASQGDREAVIAARNRNRLEQQLTFEQINAAQKRSTELKAETAKKPTAKTQSK